MKQQKWLLSDRPTYDAGHIAGAQFVRCPSSAARRSDRRLCSLFRAQCPDAFCSRAVDGGTRPFSRMYVTMLP